MRWYKQMDAKRLQLFASSLQSLVVAVGLILGGVFALVKFSTLTGFQTTELEIKLSEMELTRTGVVNLTVDLLPLDLPGDSGDAIVASFQMENVGAFRAKFATQDMYYETYQMGIDTNGSSVVQKSSGTQPIASHLDTLFLFPQEKMTFNQLIGVPEDGLYQVALRVYSRNVGSDLGASGADTTAGLSIWEASSFIVIGEE